MRSGAFFGWIQIFKSIPRKAVRTFEQAGRVGGDLGHVLAQQASLRFFALVGNRGLEVHSSFLTN
jgi:hypothetical protein